MTEKVKACRCGWIPPSEVIVYFRDKEREDSEIAVIDLKCPTPDCPMVRHIKGTEVEVGHVLSIENT